MAPGYVIVRGRVSPVARRLGPDRVQCLICLKTFRLRGASRHITSHADAEQRRCARRGFGLDVAHTLSKGKP